MDTFSYPTEGQLIKAISNLTHSGIGTLLREADLADLDPGPGTEKRWINKKTRLQTVFADVRNLCVPKPMPSGDIHESRPRRGHASEPGNGPGR